jgi:hypothetical protein
MSFQDGRGNGHRTREKVNVNVCRVTAAVDCGGEIMQTGDLRRHATQVRKVSLGRTTSSRPDVEPVLPKAEGARREEDRNRRG